MQRFGKAAPQKQNSENKRQSLGPKASGDSSKRIFSAGRVERRMRVGSAPLYLLLRADVRRWQGSLEGGGGGGGRGGEGLDWDDGACLTVVLVEACGLGVDA